MDSKQGIGSQGPAMWRAGLWAAGREFAAQATGELASRAVQHIVWRGGAAGAAAGGVVALAGIGLGTWRATNLITASFMPERPRTPTLASMAVAVLPVVVTAAAGAAAASAGALPAAAGVALGHLVERGVREAISKPLATLMPGAAMIDRQGRDVPASQRGDLELHAAAGAMAPTLAYEAARQWGVAPLQAAVGGSVAGEAIGILAASLEEGARGLSGTLAQGSAANQGGCHLAPHSGSWSQLRQEATSGKLASQVRDATSMRIYFGAFADALEAYATLPDRPIRASLLKALASELKMLAELRNYFVKRGIAAEEQRRLDEHERRARQALAQVRFDGQDDPVPRGAGIAGDDGVAAAGSEDPREVVIHIRSGPPPAGVAR